MLKSLKVCWVPFMGPANSPSMTFWTSLRPWPSMPMGLIREESRVKNAATALASPVPHAVETSSNVFFTPSSSPAMAAPFLAAGAAAGASAAGAAAAGAAAAGAASSANTGTTNNDNIPATAKSFFIMVHLLDISGALTNPQQWDGPEEALLSTRLLGPSIFPGHLSLLPTGLYTR